MQLQVLSAEEQSATDSVPTVSRGTLGDVVPAPAVSGNYSISLLV